MPVVAASCTGPVRKGAALGSGLRGGTGRVRAGVAVLAGLAGAALNASGAAAATATSTMSVTATVQATCSVSASPLAFGTYTSAQLNATSTLAVTCTNTTPYNIGLDAGTGSGATVNSRKMTSGGQTLAYGLYEDSGHSTVWGNTVGTNTVSGTGTGASQNFTVYGAIAAGQAPTPGSYADTVTVTVTY